MEWKLLPGLFEQKGDHPVVNVSWYDAKAFCEWLSRKSGKTVVLPTEAQFEYACRTGTNTAYPWGNSPGDGKGWANCADQSCKPELLKNFRDDAAKWEFFSWDDGFMFTAPVGSFKANAFGLFDMIGNACQWCSDWYDKDYYANSPKTDPHGPGSGDYFRVVRGGGWQGFVRDCRSANRGERSLGARYEDVGFRVVMDVR
jgi:formylglycine-generating enzyme required for sulfatase activity